MCWGERTTCASQLPPSIMWPVQVSSLLLPCDPEDQTEVVRLGGKWRFQLSPHLPSSVLAYNCMETKEHQYCETLRYRALIACSCVSSSACLHWGHFSELRLQEQPCSWSEKQAHLLTARCKGREASQFSTAGQQRKLTAEWDEAIWTTPYHPTEARARIDQ